jgi:hypothetical protein
LLLSIILVQEQHLNTNGSSDYEKVSSFALAIIGLIAAYIYLAKLFSPGSYVDAERYEFPVDEPTLISLVQSFKDENPQYQVPAEATKNEPVIGT